MVDSVLRHRMIPALDGAFLLPVPFADDTAIPRARPFRPHFRKGIIQATSIQSLTVRHSSQDGLPLEVLPWQSQN